MVATRYDKSNASAILHKVIPLMKNGRAYKVNLIIIVTKDNIYANLKIGLYLAKTMQTIAINIRPTISLKTSILIPLKKTSSMNCAPESSKGTEIPVVSSRADSD